MKTAMQYLNDAITANKVHAYTPKYGTEVVEAYQRGELQDVETCLYVIAELLEYCVERDEKLHRRNMQIAELKTR